MLACAQDLFFNNDKPLPRQDSFQPNSSSLQQHSSQQQQQQQQFQQQPQQRTRTNLQKMKLGKKTHMNSQHPSEKDKEEQVWPSEVEASFIEALETIPKLGRRKILVNGKPCGRNELISDFIFRKTSKVRTRKQVSSHIQVLKNTRKNDPNFMRLLTDSMDLEDELVHRKIPKTTNSSNRRPQQKHHQHRQQSFFHPPPPPNHHHHHNASLGKLATSSSISSDESSIHSSPSPADYVFDMMYGDDQALSMLDMKDPFYDTLHHPLFDTNASGLVGTNAPSTQTSNTSSNVIPGLSSRFTDLATPCNAASSPIDSASCFGLLPMDTTITTPSSSSGQHHLHLPNETDDLHSTGGMQQQPKQSSSYPHHHYQQQQNMHHVNFQPHHFSSTTTTTTTSASTPAMVEQLTTPTSKWKHAHSRLPKNSYAPVQQHRWKEHQPPPPSQPYFGDGMDTSIASFCMDQKSQLQSLEIFPSTGMPFDTSASPVTTIPSPSYNALLWPNYLCLYLEHASGASAAASSTLDLSSVNRSGCSHTLAQLPHCFPGTTTNTNASSSASFNSSILREKYQSLLQIHPSLSLISSEVILFAKMKLDLNFSMDDFFFNNTCFFESKDRLMIECTTTIYSFGNIVLESKEIQQALWIDEEKYLYNFVYVNQFFDAFMKGIRSLQSWEEVDIAIHNLCIIQVFEDIESKCHMAATALEQQQDTIMSSSSPSDPINDPTSDSTSTNTAPPPSGDDHQKQNYLLALIYEFERGQGTINITSMQDGL